MRPGIPEEARPVKQARKEKRLMESYTLMRAQDGATGEYQQVLYWRLTEKLARSIWLQVLSIPLFVVAGAAFSALAVYVGRAPEGIKIGLPELGVALAALIGTFGLHELVHGLSMRWYGARPQYGILWKQLVLYATSPGYGFRRNSYLMVALAPLLGLSCLAILGMLLLRGTPWVALISLCAAINGAGAVGDVWIVFIALRYPKSAYIVDERDGIRVLMKSG